MGPVANATRRSLLRKTASVYTQVDQAKSAPRGVFKLTAVRIAGRQQASLSSAQLARERVARVRSG